MTAVRQTAGVKGASLSDLGGDRHIHVLTPGQGKYTAPTSMPFQARSQVSRPARVPC